MLMEGGASEALNKLCADGHTINIFCIGAISNRNRSDAKQLGASAAVVYHQGREHHHMEEVLGETVTENDTSLYALIPAISEAADFLLSQPSKAPQNITIFSPSNTAVHRALDASPHEEQATSLHIIRKLGTIFNVFPNTNIQLLWLPRKIPHVGFRRACQLALEAIRTANLNELPEPHTIKRQKQTTKEAVIRSWSDIWHQNPKTSLAYKTALTRPPDGRPHPAFIRNREPAKFPRKTMSTFFQIINGHAFTGAYTQRFYPHHTQDQIACQCGQPLQTVQHVLLDCPLYSDARCRLLTANGHPRNLAQHFNHPKRVHSLLRFLAETGACARPRTVWEPG
jgi:ribonuclease HI